MNLLSWARWPIIRGGVVTVFELVTLGVAYAALIPHRRRRV